MSHAESRQFAGDGLDAAEARRFSQPVVLRIVLSVIFALCAWGLWLAYRRNYPVIFFGGLSGVLTMAAAWLRIEDRRVAEIGWMAWQRIATVIFMLALIEIGYRSPALFPGFFGKPAEIPAKMVTYAEAKDDPHRYSQWWGLFQAEWLRDQDQILTKTKGGPTPYVFKPNTSRKFFDGRVHVNSLGLVGREASFDKGDKYRIVIMGTSHSQGLPLEPGDLSWPEKLQQLIHKRVPQGERIEVLNGAAAAYNMEHNLHRLKTVLLPLKPDMIITYFGSNEFNWFRDEFRLPKIPPGLRGQKASTLVSKLDERFAKWLSDLVPDPPPIEDFRPLEAKLAGCRQAKLYEEYVRIANEAGIRLVVCNFSQAVDRDSPAEVVEFYEHAYPNAKFLIEANRLNSAMLPLVIRPETGAKLIDVQDGLDGVWGDQFLDMVHPSDAGNARLAENVFREIVDLLPVPASPTKSLVPLATRPDEETIRR